MSRTLSFRKKRKSITESASRLYGVPYNAAGRSEQPVAVPPFFWTPPSPPSSSSSVYSEDLETVTPPRSVVTVEECLDGPDHVSGLPAYLAPYIIEGKKEERSSYITYTPPMQGPLDPRLRSSPSATPRTSRFTEAESFIMASNKKRRSIWSGWRISRRLSAREEVDTHTPPLSPEPGRTSSSHTARVDSDTGASPSTVNDEAASAISSEAEVVHRLHLSAADRKQFTISVAIPDESRFDGEFWTQLSHIFA